MSRAFALRHKLIPADVAPGFYGYGGLINIGTWPITLYTMPDTCSAERPRNPHLLFDPVITSKWKGAATQIAVYLSEEPHFDVVLGRSFFEARQIQTDPLNPTDVWCGDTGEKLVCELVVVRDGRGNIISVT
jgi:hypothetical protein